MAKILIIDDDPDWQRMLSLAFNEEGCEVHYAFNGKEGYEKILSLQPDVVLLDLVMPVLSGVEVIKLATSNTLVRDIPIIVMTAHSDDADMLERSIKAQGVREYVRKPPDLARLKSLVQRMLAHYPRKAPPTSEISKGVVRFDPRFRTVWIADRRVATLSRTKAEVLKILIESKGPVRRERLLASVWGKDASRSALEKTIQRLREDLGPAGSRRIQTTPQGYELIG